MKFNYYQKMFKRFKKTKIELCEKNHMLNDPFHIEANTKSIEEINKRPLRSDVINFLLSVLGKADTKYLEIGVRNPKDNFNKINCFEKYSVDPGFEFGANPVDFKMTSDEFFNQIRNGDILKRDFKFDVIFIDGLHLANQVENDIINSLEHINDNGFIVLHDCNPPSEFHARESYSYWISPAGDYWNGTTWKAFFKYRQNKELYSCCIDTDWGIGIISKKVNLGNPTVIKNPYYEYLILDKNRSESLNLIDFEDFKESLK